MLPLVPPVPLSYTEALRSYQARYENLVQDGSYRPFLWPYCALGSYLLIAYLLLPPTKSQLVHFLRYPLFTLIVYLSVKTILECRSAWVTYNYGIGLINSWTILWGATLIIFRDARKDSKRIEGRKVMLSGECGAAQAKTLHGASTNIDHVNGGTLKSRETQKQDKLSLVESEARRELIWTPLAQKPDLYVWQGLPINFLHRLDWVLDLGSSFRGPRWFHHIPGLAPLPPNVRASLENPSVPLPPTKPQPTRKDLISQYLPEFILCLIAQDLLKFVAMQDPYFWSYTTSTESPFPWPRTSRTVLSAMWTYFALETIFLLAPLGLGVLLGPERIGEHAWSWMHTPYFGSLAEISRRGLAGAWSRWWQQLFRFAFDEAGEFASRLVGWEKKTQKGKILRVMVAFLCSAALHACGSYTAISVTNPWKPFAFFALQPVGIFGQVWATSLLAEQGWQSSTPVALRRLTNVIAVVAWFSLTGPLVADDFAECSIWLFEPIPISVIRGLRGEGWWRWSGAWMHWHAGKTWSSSGIAF